MKNSPRAAKQPYRVGDVQCLAIARAIECPVPNDLLFASPNAKQRPLDTTSAVDRLQTARQPDPTGNLGHGKRAANDQQPQSDPNMHTPDSADCIQQDNPTLREAISSSALHI